MKSLDVSLTPAEFTLLKQQDLSKTTCIVFDILRATSSMMSALANGASGILPVSEISEAMIIKSKMPEALLAGERHGLKIQKEQTGSIDFDFGNSPREFTREKVTGRKIVMTTTNGTRALNAVAGAQTVLIGSFLNLQSLVEWIVKNQPPHLLLVCAGTFDQPAFEDIAAAGAVAHAVKNQFAAEEISDAARIAMQCFQDISGNLMEGMKFSLNARRLLKNPDLADDVAFCLQQNQLKFVARLKNNIIEREN